MVTSALAGRRIGFDIEGDGLLQAIPSKGIREVSTIHCLGCIDADTDEEFYYGPVVPEGDPYWSPLLGNPTGTVEEGLHALSDAKMTFAHNGIGYDYLAIEKLYPGWKRPACAWDTLIMAKAIWPVDVLAGPDFERAKRGQMPLSLVKRHSLKAWGYRLGDNKDDYSGGFESWNPWMASYMMQDCRPMVKLFKLCERRLGWVDPKPDDLVWPESAMEMEHACAAIIAKQELAGVRFDRPRALALVAELKNRKQAIEDKLVATFGSWWQPGPVTTPAIERNVKMPEYPDVVVPRVSAKTGKPLAPYVGPPICNYSPDAPYTPIERVTFNPASRDHLGMRLQALYGWKPKAYGKNGKPTVDESTLEEIPEAVIPAETRELILNFFVVNKTLGMLALGAKSWLHLLTDEDRLHGRCDSLGTVTGRAAHSNPNLGQCPAVRKAKVADGGEVVLRGLEGRYGYEMRELFTADEGWEQTGIDASALELIDLGHYLVPYDGGAFRDRVCDPSRDPHQEHADLADLTRGNAKTATYLYIYGGTAYKLSLDIDIEAHEVPGYLNYRGLPMLLQSLAKRFDQGFVDKLDDTQKAKIAKARTIIVKFEGGIDGIKDIKASVTQAAGRGWLKGMDGRKLHVRKAHAALNTLLQSAGAQSCKLWMVLTHRYLADAGLVWGKDFKQVLWVHDELQFTHRPGLGPVIAECAERAIKEAGRQLGLRGEYRSDAKTGDNWAECH